MRAFRNTVENILIAILFLGIITVAAFGGSIFLDNGSRASVPEVLEELKDVKDLQGDKDVTVSIDESIQFPFAKVIKVTDGDTITVSTILTGDSFSSGDSLLGTKGSGTVRATEYKVRMIGINTPETVDPRKEVECFGREASAKAKEILTGKIVRLDLDPSQQKFDRYNRLLAYVYVVQSVGGIVATISADATATGTTATPNLFFNKYMIENGFAYEYTYGTPYVFQKEFKSAEQAARDAGRGLWGNSLTSGSGCN